MKILKTSALLGAMMLVYKLLGFGEKVLLAQAFGTGPSADAYLAGAGVVLLVGLLLNDIAGPAMIPAMVARPTAALRGAATTAGWVLLATIPLAAAGRAGALQLARIFGPGFDAETLALTVEIIRIGMVALPVMCVTAVLTAWYQAQERFARPATADLFLKIGPLIGLGVLGGVTGLAWGLVLGAGLRLAVLLGPGTPWRPRLGRDSELGAYLAGAWPLLATALVSVHLITVIETAIASTISAGAVATLAYARRIVDVPVILVPQVIARAAFPALAELTQRGDRAALARLLQGCVRWSFAGLAPLAVLGMVLARPLVGLLLERGEFNPAAAEATASVMVTMLPGLPALALSVLLVRFNYAAGDTKLPSWIRVGGTGVQIVFALIGRRWGLEGLGWATTLALWLETGALLLAARRIVGERAPGGVWFWWVLGAATAAAAGAGWLIAGLLGPGAGTLGLIVQLSGASAAGLAAYGLVFAAGQPAEVGRGWALLRRAAEAGR